MSNQKDNSLKVGIIVAVITAIIGPIIVFYVTQRQNDSKTDNLEATISSLQRTQISSNNSNQATSVSNSSSNSSNFSGTRSNGVLTAQPSVSRVTTSVAQQPTSTPIPTLTPIPETAPDTILELGQSWYQGGLSLALTKADLGKDNSSALGLILAFKLINLRNTDLLLSYSPKEIIKLVDNTGKTLEYSGISTYYGSSTWELASPRNYVLKSNKSSDFLSADTYDAEYPFGLFARFDFNNPNINTFTLTVSSVSTINNARWKFSINR